MHDACLHLEDEPVRCAVARAGALIDLHHAAAMRKGMCGGARAIGNAFGARTAGSGLLDRKRGSERVVVHLAGRNADPEDCGVSLSVTGSRRLIQLHQTGSAGKGEVSNAGASAAGARRVRLLRKTLEGKRRAGRDGDHIALNVSIPGRLVYVHRSASGAETAARDHRRIDEVVRPGRVREADRQQRTTRNRGKNAA